MAKSTKGRPRKYQPDNCRYPAADFTVSSLEVMTRLDRSSNTLAQWGRLPPSDPYHLYGLKKGSRWYYREQDILAHPAYGNCQPNVNGSRRVSN
jgi:hypothetical protein